MGAEGRVGSAPSDRAHLEHLRDIVPKHVFDPGFQGCGRVRTSRTGSLHLQVDDTVLKVMKNYVSAILCDRRTDARLQQFFDLRNDFVFLCASAMPRISPTKLA